MSLLVSIRSRAVRAAAVLAAARAQGGRDEGLSGTRVP